MNGIDIKLIDYRDHKRMYRKMGKEEGEWLNIDFGESLEIMRNRYMDVYDEIYAEVVMTSRFDENVDLSTTYLGRIDMKREEVMKAEESFPISEQGFVMGRLLNGEECQILLDTGASKWYMSKSYYLRCKSLHNLPKFASKTQRIQVGNGQYVGVLFVIPVIIETKGHRLEVFTLVSEIFDNVEKVLGIKNLFELDGVIDSRGSSFRFLSRSIPIFPREQVSYLYQRMPMGLNVSPPIWQTYINTILNSLQSRKYCEVIMDDLLLFTPSKKVHMDKLEDLLKALRKNGLKISPKKCQLFKTELQYMGNTLFIKERRVCIKPLCS